MSRYIWDKVNKQKVLVAGSGDESVSEIIANTEGLTSSHVYTVGNLLIHNNKLFVVTKAIAINDVLDATPTTGNIEESGTIIDEISSLKQTLESKIGAVTVKTLAANATSISFTVPTTGDNLIEFWCSDGSNYTAIDTSVSGTVTLTYEPSASARSVSCRIAEVSTS